MNIKDSFAVLTYFKILLATRARGYSGRIKECTLPRILGSSTLRWQELLWGGHQGTVAMQPAGMETQHPPPSFIPILPLFPKACKSVGWILRPVHKVNVLPCITPVLLQLISHWWRAGGAGAEGQKQGRLTLKAGVDFHKGIESFRAAISVQLGPTEITERNDN